MTTLVLAQQKLKSFIPSFNFSFAEERLESINRRGVITYSLAGLTAALAIVYLVSLYFTFGLGLQLRADNQKLYDLNKGVLATQFKTEEGETALINNKAVFMQSMEEITSIHYLNSEDNAITFNRN